MPRVSRLGLIQGAIALFALALIGKAALVQLWQGKGWAATAARQHVASDDVAPPRGRILDATGATLVESRELVRLEIAPVEVRARRDLAVLLRRAGVADSFIRRASDSTRKWVSIPGRFLPADIATLAAISGVYPAPVTERVYAASPGMRRIVGRVTPGGVPLDGMELAVDSLLQGTKGTAALLKDAKGRSFESPTIPGVAARPGHTVQLTINVGLQDITERALADAVSSLSATGGDIIVLDPSSGEILAMASQRMDPRSTASTALTEPFEPGSTLKPFTAAALLTRELAHPDDRIDTHGGVLTINGREITDVHKGTILSLTDVIRFSSNVGMAEFARRLSSGEQYESLRDFGFGAPTGITYLPTDAGGTLREPRRWSRQSAASLAIGYEIAVTPLQLALAYASIANGGELLEPSLIKEVRTADGVVVFRQRRRVVRRVMSPEVASTLRKMMLGVVENGTATGAQLATFDVAGKSGTSRTVQAGVGYKTGEYFASFVGLFPAAEPQYVILVKLDQPRGIIFGGKTAAPVTKVVLQAAIAARDAALDRRALASSVRTHATPDSATVAARAAAVALAGAPADSGASVPFVITLPAPRAVRLLALRPRPVPNVYGLTLRAAVHTLHRAGFHVQLATGPSGATLPQTGAVIPAGATVRLFYDQ